MKPLRLFVFCGLSGLGCSVGAAAEKIEDLAVPAALQGSKPLREMATDRPDATESPFTVDAGHVQIEADFMSYTRNHLDGVRSREWNYATTNLRWGVTPTVELGLFVSPWIRRTDLQPGSGLNRSVSGIGDTVLRGKLNLWGNDGGESAGGVIVDLKMPTADSGLGIEAVEATVIFPYSRRLPAGWELGAMLGLDLRRDVMGSNYTPVVLTTATVAHDLRGNSGIYFELTSEAGDGPHVATFNTGLTFHLNADTQLDCGINTGISRSAEDAQFFAGIARRF